MTAELESPGPVGPGVAPGGNVGDALIKTGAGDYQTGWAARLALGVASALALSSVAAPGVAVAAAHEDHVHPAVAAAAAPGDVALIAQAAASATANVQEWRDSAATLQAGVTAAGSVMVATLRSVQASKATLQPNGDTGGWLLQTQADANKGLVIRRNSATQSVTLFETQNEAGSFNFRVFADGSAAVGTTSTTAAYLNVGGSSPAAVQTIVRGAVSQTGDLVQLQSSAGAVLAAVNNNGRWNGAVGSTASGKATLSPNGDTGGFLLSTAADANKGLVIRSNSGTQSAHPFEIQDAGGTPIFYAFPSGTMVSNGRVITGGADYTAGFNATAPQSNQIGMIVQGVASQTGDLLQLRSSAAAVLINVTGGGSFQASDPGGVGNHTFGSATPAGNTELTVDSRFATWTALAVRGRSGQSADPTKWLAFDGTVNAGVSPVGRGYFGTTGPVTSAALSAVAVSTSSPALVAKGQPAQTFDLVEIQDSAAGVIARINAAGAVYGGTVRTLSDYVIVSEQNSGGSLQITKQNAQAGVAAAGTLKLYVRDGTNAGTLKLVALGPGNVQVTIVDNVA